MHATSETAAFVSSHIAMGATPMTSFLRSLFIPISLSMQHEDRCAGHMPPGKHQTCVYDPLPIVSALPPHPPCFTRPRDASTVTLLNAVTLLLVRIPNAPI